MFLTIRTPTINSQFDIAIIHNSFFCQETEKLVVFMLGFVSHQVADITWHSLGIQQGFLQTMGKVNFYGSFNAAHSIGDPGGDMVATLEGDTRQISSAVENW